ncbi:MAG: hypothetical protein H0T59_06535 [Chloroflexi bacterium]|nr:hypothetical protein [Chloroflexota bacterium]
MSRASGSVTPGGVLGQALLVTLVTPATWVMALAVFLIRGGILLVALPILVLPTPVGLGNVLSPALSSIAFGSLPIEILVVATAIALGSLIWLVVGGWIAATLEAEAVRVVASDEDLVPLLASSAPVWPTDRRLVATQVLIARLVAYLPLAVALSIGSVRIVFVTYRELTSPFDVESPIVLRVLLASPEVVVTLVVTWMLGEIVGAGAVRRITLGGVGVARALLDSVVVLVRHPLSSLVRFWVPTVALLLVTGPSVLAAGAGWDSVRSALATRTDPAAIVLTTFLFVGLWVVGLLLIGVVSAWRAAVWTVAATRTGTFEASVDRRPGDWRNTPTSERL